MYRYTHIERERYVYMYVYMYLHTYMYIYTYIYVYMFIHVYIYIYMHIEKLAPVLPHPCSLFSRSGGTDVLTDLHTIRQDFVTPHDLTGLQQTNLLACFTIISKASIDILQNGWPEICCVTIPKQEMT